ncbi:MAG: HAD family phosphatase [Firmicutes bacterium]|nr:HAD family phosphatase [Bacillota bacterium]
MKDDKIQLIALDLDGTTLTRGHITRRTRRALEKAIEAGVSVVVATGRAYVALPNDVFRIKGLRYVMNSNGAQITDLTTGQIIYENHINKGSLEKVLALFRQLQPSIEVFTDGNAYIDKSIYEDLKCQDSVYAAYMSRDYVLRTRKPVEHILDFMEAHISRIENINVEFENLEEKARMKVVLEQIPGVTITSSMTHNLEIGGQTTSKASGLVYLCQLMGFAMEKVMACGDSPNDMAMLREAGFSIAMGNGEQEVKDMADFVAPANEEEGVAYCVERFVLGKNRPAWQLMMLKRKNLAAWKLRRGLHRFVGPLKRR